MFSFFKKKPAAEMPIETDQAPAELAPEPAAPVPAAERSWLAKLRIGGATPAAPEPLVVAESSAAERETWMTKLRNGLRKTGSSIAQVFTGTQIDDALYEELEAALLMADAGVKATEFLLADLKQRVKDSRTTEPAAVKGLLCDAITAVDAWAR